MKIPPRIAGVSLALLLTAFTSTNALAQAALGLPNGTALNDGSFQYHIVRTDLAPVLAGAAVSPYMLASGYLNVLPLNANRSFVIGSAPVQESELQQALNLFNFSTTLTITSINQEATLETPKLVWIHFEGSDTNKNLKSTFQNFSMSSGNGGSGVFVPATVVDPNFVIPPQYKNLTNGIHIDQISSDVLEINDPRPDQNQGVVEGHPASAYGGYGETFFIQALPNGNAIMNVKLTVTRNEVPVILNYLEGNGFVVNGIHRNFIVGNSNLSEVITATATGAPQTLFDTLFAALGNIFAGSNAQNDGKPVIN